MYRQFQRIQPDAGGRRNPEKYLISWTFPDICGCIRKEKWCPEEKTIIPSNKLLLFFNADLVFLGGTSAGITICAFQWFAFLFLFEPLEFCTF